MENVIGSTTVLSIEKTEKAIQSIARRGKALDRDIQIAGVSACYHAKEKGSGDASLVQSIAQALSKGKNRNAFKVWIATHTCIDIDNNGKTTMSKSDDRKGIFDLESLEAENWFDCKAPPKETQVTVESITKIIQAYIDDKKDNVVVSKEALELSVKLMAKINEPVKKPAKPRKAKGKAGNTAKKATRKASPVTSIAA